jgi:hypothetical protein
MCLIYPRFQKGMAVVFQGGRVWINAINIEKCDKLIEITIPRVILAENDVLMCACI